MAPLAIFDINVFLLFIERISNWGAFSRPLVSGVKGSDITRMSRLRERKSFSSEGVLPWCHSEGIRPSGSPVLGMQ